MKQAYTPKRYNEPFKTSEQLRPRTSTLALKCVGTVKAIFEGPRPPVASCNCLRDASWRPLDFSPAISVRCFYDASLAPHFESTRGIPCIFRYLRGWKDHPRAFISSSEGLWKKTSGRSLASWNKRSRRRVSGSFHCFCANASMCIRKLCLFDVAGEIKISPIFQSYLWETWNVPSLTFQSLQGFIVWFIIRYNLGIY